MTDWRAGYNTGSELRERAEWRTLEAASAAGLRGAAQVRLAGYLMASRVRGWEEYGPDFAGDPVQHAREEVYDALLYLATAIEAGYEGCEDALSFAAKALAALDSARRNA